MIPSLILKSHPTDHMFRLLPVLCMSLLRTEALPDWLVEQGLAGRVRIVNVSAGQRGLQADSTQEYGEEMLSIPLQHVFCFETVIKQQMGSWLAERSDLLMSDVLAAALAEHGQGLGDASLLRLLPRDLSHHPILYDEETWQLADKLVSGRLLRSALDEVQQSWHRVSRAFTESSMEPSIFEQDYLWAQAILRSRGHSVRFRTRHGEWRSTWGLIPMADMINMDPTPNVDCRTRYASEDPDSWGLNGTFVCTALARIKAGEELWTEYVSKPELRTSATFLREYGFVPRESPHDALSWLPKGCTRLHCMVRLENPTQLQEHLGVVPGLFIEQALYNSSSVISQARQPALQALAHNEQKLLLEIRDAWDRSELAKALFERWRGEPDLHPSSAEAQQLFEVLRSPEALHTIHWDRAIWDAGLSLLSHWDDGLAAEVLYSHHDFTPALEEIFRLHRKEAITKSALRCAFAAQALLNDFAWPIDDEEQVAVSETSDTLVRAMYVADKIEASRCPRAEALQSEREWEAQENVERCPYWKGLEEAKVHELYTSHPYPSWRRFGFMSSDKKQKVKRTLIAGVGTGKAVLAHLQHFDPEEILAVDLSRRSLQVAKRQLLALGIQNVVLWQCDLNTLEGQFDVIESIGVLHHLSDPTAGFAAMKRLLAPGGTLVLGVYSRMARRSISVMRDLAGNASYERFRAWLGDPASGPEMRAEERAYLSEFLTEFSISSRSTFEDLLLHPVEHLFELPELEELLAAAGLRVTGVRVPPGSQGVADRWLPYFSPQRRDIPGWPPMPLLAFLHRIETEMEPLLFTNMYVFIASHGSSAILKDMSRWVSGDALEDVESLPLPFEPEWPREVLGSAVQAFCSRTMHHVKSTSRWVAPVVDSWLEAKVALGPHSARIGRVLQTEDAVARYCEMLSSHFLA